MDRPLTGAERQARYRARHPERIAAARAAYRASEHGQAVIAAANARQVWVCGYYVGMAPTIEEAQSLNQQAKERFHGR